MKNKAIILDFDHTLYNTTLYVAKLKDVLAQEGIAQEVFDDKRQYLKDCCSVVDIDTFITHLPVTDKERLHNVIHNMIKEHAASFVFEDVQNFIDRHKEDFDIVVVTQGDEELQTEKIEHSGITGIDDVIITQGEKDDALSSVVEKYEELHFIDDKAKHVDEVKQAFPQITTYFIQRPEDRPYGDIISVCECNDHTIENLSLTIA